MSLATKIKEFLKYKLNEKQLSRKDLAEATKIPYTTISRIMKSEMNSREFNPEIDTILKIADFFDCAMDEVIGRELGTVMQKQKI